MTAEGRAWSEPGAAGAGGGVLVGPPEAPRRIGGIEHRLPLFHEGGLETPFDHLPPAAPLALDPGIGERRAAWLEQIADAYESRPPGAAGGGGLDAGDPPRRRRGPDPGVTACGDG